MMKYDLHMHTHYSKCSDLKPEIILKLSKKKKLDGIAITDHHEIKGALEVSKLNKDKNFEVIVGEEVSTDKGDVLLYYLEKKVYETEFYRVVEEARKQNALIIIPHPFRRTMLHDHKFQMPLEKIKNIADAIECFNARMMFPSDNKKADLEASRLGMAKTGGSDAHFSFEIGTGCTAFEGNLRGAIKNKKTVPVGRIKFGLVGGVLSYLRKTH
ncbi:MAG TPA: PHP domain-containing protein [Candidatus Nanoarchaeia archaeon]|nr:PHP domain-containing protein [Candidatus Nanoarchaeia archaeon]